MVRMFGAVVDQPLGRRPAAAGQSTPVKPSRRPLRPQTLAAQDAALRGAGCAKVYSETASGAKTDRAALRKAVARLDEGDMLMVTRLDRLARPKRTPGGADIG